MFFRVDRDLRSLPIDTVKNKKTLIVCCFSIGSLLVVLSREGKNEESSLPEQVTVNDYQRKARNLPSSLSRPAERQHSNEEEAPETEGYFIDPQYPAADEGPSIPEQIASARGTFFNFNCSCCGDHLKYARILEDAGLVWPKVWEGLEDEVAFHNLKHREEQAILRVLHDPHSAVDFFTEQISFEREKLEVRQLRQPWDESRSEGGPGDLSSFKAVMSGVNDHHFEAMVHENLPVIARSSAHLNTIVEAAWKRDEGSRLRSFARLVDAGALNTLKDRNLVSAELTRFLGGYEPEGDGYLNAVSARLDPAISRAN